MEYRSGYEYKREQAEKKYLTEKAAAKSKSEELRQKSYVGSGGGLDTSTTAVPKHAKLIVPCLFAAHGCTRKYSAVGTPAYNRHVPNCDYDPSKGAGAAPTAPLAVSHETPPAQPASEPAA